MSKKHLIEIQIEEQLVEEKKAQIPTQPIREAALSTLAYANIAEPCEAAIVISDDATLHDLNRRFRGVDRPTDVIAFTNDPRGPFGMGAPGMPRYLGDIVISVERAAVQAEEAGGSLTEELQLLTVHGMLHLLGYDHATLAEKTQMWTAQAAVLEQLGIDIPLPE
ncbi:MAG: rRNA maturation RNase YbeY [Anaerolineales bacterium]